MHRLRVVPVEMAELVSQLGPVVQVVRRLQPQATLRRLVAKVVMVGQVLRLLAMVAQAAPVEQQLSRVLGVSRRWEAKAATVALEQTQAVVVQVVMQEPMVMGLDWQPEEMVEMVLMGQHLEMLVLQELLSELVVVRMSLELRVTLAPLALLARWIRVSLPVVWDPLALNPAIHPLVRTVDPVVQVVMAAQPAQRVTVAQVDWEGKLAQVVLLV